MVKPLDPYKGESAEEHDELDDQMNLVNDAASAIMRDTMSARTRKKVAYVKLMARQRAERVARGG